MVLVRVLRRVRVDGLRVQCPRRFLDGVDGGSPFRDGSVFEAAPQQFGAEDRGRVLLLLHPGPRRLGALLARCHDEEPQPVAPALVRQERSPAAELDVVGVGPDG